MPTANTVIMRNEASHVNHLGYQQLCELRERKAICSRGKDMHNIDRLPLSI